MPSPLAHSAMGYLLYRAAQRGQPPERSASQRIGPLPWLLLVTVGVSILPDLDFVAGLIFGDIRGFHNQISHSLVVGTGFALLSAGVLWLATRRSFWRWFIIVGLSYYLHVIMDFFTYKTRGIMLFWPFSDARFEGAVKLFFGVRWSEGLWTASHLITLVTELGFVLLLVISSGLWSRYRLTTRSAEGDKPILEEGGL